MTADQTTGSIPLIKRFCRNDPIATLREIADRAGTSISTVSVVLNDRASTVRISEATRRTVLEAASAVGYTPHLAARRLRSNGTAQRTLVLAIAHPIDSRLSLVSRIVAGMQRQLARVTDEVQLTIETFVPGALNRLRGLEEPLWYNGLLITNTTARDDEFLASAQIGTPVVLFQRYGARSYVNVDSRAAGRQVAEHLLALGHRRLAMVVPGALGQAQQLRIEGFNAGLAAAGLPPAEVLAAQQSSWTGDGYAAAQQLLARPAAARPTALFATNDLIALGVIRAARDVGAAVPGDLAVVGCDDAEFARFAVPSLTTIHVPLEEMAAAGADILLDLIQRRAVEPIVRLFEPRLVVRESCGAQS